MNTASQDSGGDEVLAAEYVMHLLKPDDRHAAEERLAIDGGFRALVAEWTEDLVGLADEVAPVPPPDRVRDGLLAATGPAPATTAARPAKARSGRGFSLGRLFGGGVGGAAALGLAVVLLAVALPQVEPPYSGPFFQGELGAEAGLLRVSAFVDPRDHTITLERVAGTAPQAGRDRELWVIADGQPGPISLGLLAREGPTRIVVPDAVAPLVKSGTLAISDEPEGGSPTGAPTGDILATGSVTEV